MDETARNDEAVQDSELARDNAGVIAPPPLIPLGYLALGLLLQRVLPAPLLPERYRRVVGWALVGAAIALNAWFIRTMRMAETPIDPRKPVVRVVTTGPLGLSRNPSYLSFNLLYLGIAVLANTRWPLMLWPAMLTTLTKGVVEREERYLEATFGDEYRDYKAQVRRWL